MQYTTAQAQSYLRQHLKWEAAKEYRHQQTRQGAFERDFIRYDAFADIDPDHNRFLRIPARALSPADRAQLKLDLPYFAAQLRRTDRKLYAVFCAVLRGLSWRDLGVPESTWFHYLKKVEDFLGAEG